MAIVGVVRAFIDICTERAVSDIPGGTRASKRAWRIRTGGIHCAIIGVHCAFIDVGARDTVARIPGIAYASEGPRCIDTRGVRIAIVGIRRAFIDIDARRAIAHEPCIARKAAHAICARGLTVYDVGTNRAAHAAILFVRVDIHAARIAQRWRSRGTLVGADVLATVGIGSTEWIRIGTLRAAHAAVLGRRHIRFATIGRVIVAIGKTHGADDRAHSFFAHHAGRVDVGRISTIFFAGPAIVFVCLEIRANTITQVWCRRVACIATTGPRTSSLAAFATRATGSRHSGSRAQPRCRGCASVTATCGNERTRRQQNPTTCPNFS